MYNLDHLNSNRFCSSIKIYFQVGPTNSPVTSTSKLYSIHHSNTNMHWIERFRSALPFQNNCVLKWVAKVCCATQPHIFKIKKLKYSCGCVTKKNCCNFCYIYLFKKITPPPHPQCDKDKNMRVLYTWLRILWGKHFFL